MEEIIPFTTAAKTIAYLKLNSIRNVQEIYKENSKTSKGHEKRPSKQAEGLYKFDAIAIKIPLALINFSRAFLVYLGTCQEQ